LFYQPWPPPPGRATVLRGRAGGATVRVGIGAGERRPEPQWPYSATHPRRRGWWVGVHASEYGLHRRSAAEPGVLAQAQRPRARRVDYEKLDRKYALRGGESASEPRCRFGPRMGGIGGVRGQVGEYAWGGNQVQAAYSPPYRILHSFPLPETCPPPAHHLRGRAVEYARGGIRGRRRTWGGGRANTRWVDRAGVWGWGWRLRGLGAGWESLARVWRAGMMRRPLGARETQASGGLAWRRSVVGRAVRAFAA